MFEAVLNYNLPKKSSPAKSTKETYDFLLLLVLKLRTMLLDRYQSERICQFHSLLQRACARLHRAQQFGDFYLFRSSQWSQCHLPDRSVKTRALVNFTELIRLLKSTESLTCKRWPPYWIRASPLFVSVVLNSNEIAWASSAATLLVNSAVVSLLGDSRKSNENVVGKKQSSPVNPGPHWHVCSCTSVDWLIQVALHAAGGYVSTGCSNK